MYSPVEAANPTIPLSTYVQELQELFAMHRMRFGSPQDVVPFTEALTTPGTFHDEMTSMVRSIFLRHGGNVPRAELLQLVMIAVGGPQIDESAEQYLPSIQETVKFLGEVHRTRWGVIPTELPAAEAAGTFADAPPRFVPQAPIADRGFPVAGAVQPLRVDSPVPEFRTENLPPRRNSEIFFRSQMMRATPEAAVPANGLTPSPEPMADSVVAAPDVPAPVVAVVAAPQVPLPKVATAGVTAAEVPVPEAATANVAAAEVPVLEAATADVAAAEVPVPEAATANVAAAEVPVPEAATAEVAAAEVPVLEAATANVDAAEVPVPEAATAEVAAAEVALPEAATTEVAAPILAEPVAETPVVSAPSQTAEPAVTFTPEPPVIAPRRRRKALWISLVAVLLLVAALAGVLLYEQYLEDKNWPTRHLPPAATTPPSVPSFPVKPVAIPTPEASAPVATPRVHARVASRPSSAPARRKPLPPATDPIVPVSTGSDQTNVPPETAPATPQDKPPAPVFRTDPVPTAPTTTTPNQTPKPNGTPPQ